MARMEAIERRLLEWAEALKVGDGSGYSTKCTLHPEWSPPAPGRTPTMKVAAPSHAKQTHRAVLTLSLRLQDTIVRHYLQGMSVAEQAAQLGCVPGTVDQRIWTAHRQLAAVLDSEASGGSSSSTTSTHRPSRIEGTA